MPTRRLSPILAGHAALSLLALGAEGCTTIIDFPDYLQATTGGTTSTTAGGAGGATTTTSTGAGGTTTTTTGAGGTTTGAGGSGGTTTGSGGATTTTTGAGGSGGTTTGSGGSGGAGGAPLGCAGAGGAYAPGPGGATGACRWSRSYGERPSDVAWATYQAGARMVRTPKGDAVILSGSFGQSIDLGKAASMTSPQALFVARVEAATGDTTWQTSFEGVSATSRALAVDPSGNIVIGGYFLKGSMTIGGPLTTAADVAMFLAKLDSSGNVTWAKSWDVGPVDGVAAGAIVRVGTDGLGNIYAGGTLHGTVDFGNATGALATPAGGATDAGDAFLVKLDGGGKALWAKRWGDAAAQSVEAIAVDGLGSTYVVGEYAGTLAFGAGGPSISAAGGADATVDDAYVAKIDTNGVAQWARSYGDAGHRQSAQGVALGVGHIYVIGDMSGTIDTPAKSVTAATHATFVMKLSTDGATLALQAFTGADWAADAAITVAEPSGDAYVAGRFPGTMTIGAYSFKSAGDDDVFAARLTVTNNDFTPVWAAQYGDEHRQIGTDVALAGGRLLVYGTYYGKLALGCGTHVAAHFGLCPDAGVPASAGATDAFLAGLEP